MRKVVVVELRSSLSTPLVRNSALILATALLGYGIGFLFWLLVARLYDPAVVGLSATLLSTVLFLATIATLGFPLGLIRFLPDEKDRVGLINTALTVVGITSVVIGLMFVVGLDVLAPALSVFVSSPWLAAMCVLSVVGFAIAAVIDATFVAARRAEYGMIRHAISNIARFPLVPLLGALVLGVFGVVVSWTLAIVLSVGIATLVFLPRLYPRFRVALTFRHVRNPGVLGFSVWNQASVVIGAAASSLLPLIILNTGTSTGGPSEAAYFFAAFTIASVLYLVPASFTTSLFVEGSYSDVSDPTQVARTIWVSMSLLVLGILVIVFLGRWILDLFGQGYSQAGYGTLVLLALSSPVVLINAILVTDLRVTKRVRPLLGITALSTGVALSVAYAAVPYWGILGAGVGFVLGHVIALPMLAAERKRNRSVAAHFGTKM